MQQAGERCRSGDVTKDGMERIGQLSDDARGSEQPDG
jgi:hypothetical protein